VSKNGFIGLSLVLVALTAGCGGTLEPEAGDAEVGASEHELIRCGLDCPYGYVPSFWTCTSTCGSCNYGGQNAVSCTYVGQQVSISGSPQTVSVAAGQLGTSRICWNTMFLNAPVWIRVRVNGQAGQLFTKESDNGSACENAAWIGAGNSYVFSVHTSNADSAPVLASTTVTGVLSTTPPPPPPGETTCRETGCQSGYDCRCGDVCRRVGTMCP
jgi:hypothetical protein